MSNEMRLPEPPSRIIHESPAPRAQRADDRDVHLSGDDLLLASWQSYRSMRMPAPSGNTP
ncbi:MAG: hypothetical protein M3068_02155 [Gemmatimonadota bacterium]|nr:hypothetical protein [Gemmatimonadota bacterium]